MNHTVVAIKAAVFCTPLLSSSILELNFKHCAADHSAVSLKNSLQYMQDNLFFSCSVCHSFLPLGLANHGDMIMHFKQMEYRKKYPWSSTLCLPLIVLFIFFFFLSDFLQNMSTHTIMGHHLCRPSGSMTNMNQQHLIKDDLDTPYLV